ncbi:hypothetical protein EN836_33120 [Mesorhizobium sp. M1C.F.Ca.ET.193.01.1.1]|uniref:hypothetical protein n=2 Tax=Mesorhizobium TaxID=68287 RepID=UPI000FD75FC4|nr:MULTISPECIES: hypothetical protein [unclassified Mesorhizobium]TGR74839.1 hypothetical protein EN836_33120 [Mesorhizobium sp. M1C.F.Ca.ET.193.01.1.1]TGT64066.1 hypothetical protein EN809_034995 [Mesorhizobium sp. M2E.F.Ca.ET.166.01.1.1]TGV97051.1 hypothetical protein EN797_035170 [Mesorhizobium sp. M2E.F.Ca.ET.154.01.1.1]
MLTHSQARSIAEAVWGTGGTHSTRTNRNGAFYFSCSSHGGFVIDARCLAHDEYARIRRYVDPEQAEDYGKAVNHPYRRRSFKVTHAQLCNREDFEFFLLEEDCDWCLAPLMADIRTLDGRMTNEDAQRTFDQWIAPRALTATFSTRTADLSA